MAKKVIYSWSGKSLEQEEMVVKGKKILATRLRLSDSVGIIALTNDDKIILERQFRKGVKKWIYEIPAGHIEKGENKIAAVRRELQEEVGYYPKKVKFLFKEYISPGIETELESIYLATDLVKSKKKMDDDEIIETKTVTKSELRKMIKQNKILDASSLAALLYYLSRE